MSITEQMNALADRRQEHWDSADAALKARNYDLYHELNGEATKISVRITALINKLGQTPY